MSVSARYNGVHFTQKETIDLTARKTTSTPEKRWRPEEKLLFGLDIKMAEDGDSELENDFPTFFIHNLNECL